jgi:leader peptidase (prepilin peptidase)/N-methyltransferase
MAKNGEDSEKQEKIAHWRAVPKLATMPAVPPDILLYIAVGLFGAAIGSFLNVCIHRLPRHESIVWPSSRCPACGGRIAPYDNIPILSFLWLRGRCRACRAPISLRYPLVEAANGLGYVWIAQQFGFGWSAAAYAALFSALLVVTFIDLDHQIIPDRVTLPGIPLGILCAAVVLPTGLFNSLLGVLVGGGLLWFMAWISPYLFGKEGMGGGDIKLLAMVGAFLGWEPVLLTVLVGASAGALTGLLLIAFKRLRRDQHIPFGPFLALGAVVAMFFFSEIKAWYAGFFVP